MSAAERVREYLKNQAQMSNLDHEYLHIIQRAGERHDLLASDLWELVRIAEERDEEAETMVGEAQREY